MDVMKPELYWVDNRCYRQLYISTKDSNERHQNLPLNIIESEEEEIPSDLQFEQENGIYKLNLQVASTFYPFLIGQKGCRKIKLESETNTKIRFPSQYNPRNQTVEVTGSSKESLVKVKDRIDILVASQRHRFEPTHFLSLPFNHKNLIQGFQEFKEDVLRLCSSSEIDEQLFQNPQRLHLTLAMLILCNDSEVRQARDFLKSCQGLVSQHLQNRPLEVRVAGLEYMNDDPHMVDVLYAKVACNDSSNRLQNLADALVRKFEETGLIKRDYDDVKLHLTLMNSAFTRDSQQRRKTFDASKILETLSNYYFGTITIPELHLSLRHSSRDQYYKSTEVLKLSPLPAAAAQ